MKKYGKKYNEVKKNMPESKQSLLDALTICKENSTANFDESIDAVFSLGIDTKVVEENIRTTVSLPHGNGKTYKVAVFAEGDEAKEAKDAGADQIGMEDLAEDIKKGNIDFDVIIATPETMRVVSPLGQILGPKGLMPNPKSETVTKDVSTAVKNSKAGQIRYKSDKQGIIHSRIGQVGYTDKQLEENLVTFLADVKKAKPPSAKGVYISKVSISSTMGKGLELDMSALSF